MHRKLTHDDETPKARRVVQLFMAGGASHIDLFDFKPELAKRHGERTKTNWAATEFVDKRFEDTLVHFVKTVAIDVEHGQCLIGDFAGDTIAGADLSVIPHPP